MGNSFSCINCDMVDQIPHVEMDIHHNSQQENHYEDIIYGNKHVKSAKVIQSKFRKFKCFSKLIQKLFILIERKMKSIEVISVDDFKERIDENKLKILKSFEEEIKAKRKNKTTTRINRINFGAMLFNEKNEYYLGEWNLKAEKSGLGTLIMQDQSIYYGYFENDLFHGNGVYINELGYYYGEWKEGKFWGTSTLKYFNSIAEYRGNWIDNFREGLGEEKYEDGSFYKGNFKSNEIDGYGIYIWPDGSKYEGHLKNSHLEGKGIFTWADGRSYEGFWKENKFHGVGIHKWPNGSYYDGHYKLGKRNGEGVYCWNNDIYYNGLWLNNLQHGEGTLTIKNKNHYGGWRYGKLIRMSEISEIEENINFLSEKNDTFYDTPVLSSEQRNHHKTQISHLIRV
jgi:hypothetical protein